MLDLQKLIDAALDARNNAYSPYSNFCVGAALLCADGEIIKGANIENSSFGGTICAERSAFCAALSSGKKDFVAIAVVGGLRDKPIEKLCAPCGICRQFMSEFCGPDFPVILYDGKNPVPKTLGEIFPETFDLGEY